MLERLARSIAIEDAAQNWTRQKLCSAASAYFAAMFGKPGRLDGLFEDLFSLLPQDYTFARLTMQGAYLGGGFGMTASRYTNRSTLAETFVFSVTSNFGAPFRGSISGLGNITSVTQALGRLATLGAGFTYGSSSGPDAAPLGAEGEFVGTPFSFSLGGGDGQEIGGGGGLGASLGLSASDDKTTVTLDCGGRGDGSE